MRVIGGKARGRRLKMVPGVGLRPTSDLVRGAIFSMLEAMDVSWGRVLDLYAGTGALGIEALSRGAEWADFVERHPRCCAVIEENLRRTGFEGQGRVHCLEVERALNRLEGEYEVIFLDPPYDYPPLGPLLQELGASTLVVEETRLVVEHWRRVEVPDQLGRLRLLRERRHGDTRISIYG